MIVKRRYVHTVWIVLIIFLLWNFVGVINPGRQNDLQSDFTRRDKFGQLPLQDISTTSEVPNSNHTNPGPSLSTSHTLQDAVSSEGKMAVEHADSQDKSEMAVDSRQDKMAVDASQDKIGVHGSQDKMGVHGSQDKMGVHGSKDKMGVHGSQDKMGVHGSQDKMGVHGSKDKMGVHGSQDKMGVHGSKDKMGVHGSKDKMGVHTIQDKIGVHGSQDKMGVNGSEDKMGVHTIQDKIGVHGSQDKMGVHGSRDKMAVDNSKRNIVSQDKMARLNRLSTSLTNQGHRKIINRDKTARLYRSPTTSLSLEKIKSYNHELLTNNRSFQALKHLCLEKSKYEQHVGENLKAWHRFVPDHTSMDSNNCWSDHILNHVSLNLTRKMHIGQWDAFMNIEKRFWRDDLEGIVRNNITTAAAQHSNYNFCLPKMFLIGFMKCGTTLMHENFVARQDYVAPPFKEPHFWRELVKHTDIEYKEIEVLMYLFHFLNPAKSIKFSKQEKLFTSDATVSTVWASPELLHEDDACVLPATMHNIFPNSKFIVLLRNPVERIWSEFWYHKTRTAEMFHRYTETAIQGFLKCTAQHSLSFCTWKNSNQNPDNILRIGLGMYHVHLQRWFNVFPREQVLVIHFEDWLSNFSSTMSRVWSFLGVPEAILSVQSVVNGNVQLEHKDMLPKTRELLKEFYRPHNIKLAELLDDTGYLSWND